ncbi:MAG: hypothetical protein H7647_10820, partial [Candidatus Heimdallarchaeota archaeon]|nr:hypothetical protein [Candidatus Heimdallarchaeota archaeon]MCK4254917.1 hypothetical protein [Candidatus Heimdallarchaeota archaeon]
MCSKTQKTFMLIIAIALFLSPYTAMASTSYKPTIISNINETSGVISVVTTLSIIADWASQVGDTLF